MEIIIKPPKGIHLNLKELWVYRELLFMYTWREIKIKYKQTVLGMFWVILQPLFLMFIFTLIFSRAFNNYTGSVPYPIFIYSGLMLWEMFSTGLSNSTNTMVWNAQLIKKVYFPRLILPISSVLVSFFDFIFSFLIFIFILIYFHHSVDLLRLIIYLPLSLFITGISSLGTGLILTTLNIKYRDVKHIIPFIIRILFFITPVIYPLSFIQNKTGHFILSINPIAGAVELLRSAIVNKNPEWNIVMTGIICSLVILLSGIIIFKYFEKNFADIS